MRGLATASNGYPRVTVLRRPATARVGEFELVIAIATLQSSQLDAATCAQVLQHHLAGRRVIRRPTAG